MVLSSPAQLYPSQSQNSTSDFKNNFSNSENIVSVVDSKVLELQNISELATTVKVESVENLNDQAQEDYCTGFDDEYSDTKDNIPLVTKEEPKPVTKKTKKSASEKSISIVTKYGQFAKLLRSVKKDWGDSVENNFNKVKLTETEIEEYLNQTDRCQRSFANHPYKCEVCVKGYLRQTDFQRHNDLNHHKVMISFFQLISAYKIVWYSAQNTKYKICCSVLYVTNLFIIYLYIH